MNVEHTAVGYTETTQGPIKHHRHKMENGNVIYLPVCIRFRRSYVDRPQVPLKGKDGGYMFALPGGGRIEA